MARHSIWSRCICAWRKASAIIPRALADCGPVWMTSLRHKFAAPEPVWTTATLRCGEENSTAKIFIRDAAFVFTQSVDLNPAQGVECGMRNAECGVFR